MAPLSILYLDHAAELGGAEFSLLALLRTLDRRGFAPTLACPPGQVADRGRLLGVPLLDLHLGKLRTLNPLRFLGRLRDGRAQVRALLGRGPFQIVHANTLRAALCASRVARKSGARFIWHVRDYAVPRWARSLVLRDCHAAIAPSEFIAGSLGRRRKVHVIPNGIDLVDLPPEAASAAFRREWGIPPEAPVIGCLGRVLPWKGQRYFVDVVAHLASRLPGACFLVVGSAVLADASRDHVAELKAYAEEAGVAPRILFTGQREDPLAALGAMDIVVNCSENEPFGRVLIEAMACRRPIVAFRSGAVPEIVEDGSTGLLVPFGDAAGMAEAVFDLVRNRTRAEAYGEAGRHRVASLFSLKASTRRIEELYAALLSS